MAGVKGMKGGGRHKAETPRVQVTVRVAQETNERIKELRKQGWRFGRWLDLEIPKL